MDSSDGLVGGHSLRKSMQVLRLFGPDRPELAVGDVVTLLGWPKSSTRRLLAAMQESGFLDRDTLSARYRVGLRLANLGALAVHGTSLQRAAQPELQSLAQRTGETANLAVLSGREVVNIGVEFSTRAIKHMGWVGRRMPIHATAAGKALAAWREDAFSELLPKPRASFTRRTITSERRLRTELASVRTQGWSSAYGELEEDLVGIGAPVRDHTGGVIGVVTISAPVFRIAEDQTPEYGRQVRAAAERVSAALGYVTPATTGPRPRSARVARVRA